MPGPFYGGLGMVSSGVERMDRAYALNPDGPGLQIPDGPGFPMVRDLQSRTGLRGSVIRSPHRPHQSMSVTGTIDGSSW